MFLKRCLLALSALITFASLALIDARSALAFTVYDFDLTLSDGTTGSGWFSVDETPEYAFSHNRGISEKVWYEFLDFEFNYAGINYNEEDLNNSRFEEWLYPETSPHPFFGDFYRYLSFELPSLYVDVYSTESNTSLVGSGSIYSPAPFFYSSATSSTIKQRTVPVPTPSLIPALIGAGAAALRKRKNELDKEVLEPTKA